VLHRWATPAPTSAIGRQMPWLWPWPWSLQSGRHWPRPIGKGARAATTAAAIGALSSDVEAARGAIWDWAASFGVLDARVLDEERVRELPR